MIIELLMITVIICFIVDISGIIESVEWWLSKWLNGNVKIPKPFSCSLCLSWWVGLIWIIIYGFSLKNLLFVSLFAMMSEQITQILLTIKYLIHRLIDWIRFIKIE